MLVFVSAAVAGCWDLKEPNELTFVFGSGWDETDDGNIEVSVQVPIPREIQFGQGGGGAKSGKAFTVMSGAGKNIFDASRRIQEKASRTLHPGHRIALIISEGVAKKGIAQYLDELIRNPDSNTRADLIVVKGISAKRFLETEYPMEINSSWYAFRTSTIIGFRGHSINDFQRESNNPVKCFVLPVVTPDSNGKGPQLIIHEIALFDKEHKMVDTLKDRDAFLALWAAGKLTHTAITQYISQGNGTITLDVQKLKRQVKVNVDGERIRMKLMLSGKGIIRENNTNLYLLSPAIKESVAKEMNEKTQKEVRQAIVKVQKQYKTDIFGFGNEIGWKHPDQWKKLADHWEDTFSNLDVSIDVKLTIQGVGQVGSGPITMK